MTIPKNADPAGLLRDVRLFMLDMDGTFYLGSRLLPGSREFLPRLAQTGREYVFLTNNSSRGARDYAAKLAGMGLDIPAERIVTSGEATADYLRRHHDGAGVFLMGNGALRAEFADAGIRLTERAPDVVVTAFDTELDYRKLCAACAAVRAGATWIGTHPDLNCPTEDGCIPDAGAMHALITASTGRVPDVIIGKPEIHIARYALSRAGCSASQTAMVGDRLYTDIALAERNGLLGILVLSGETVEADIAASPAKPRLIFDRLGDIAGLL